MCLKRRFKLSAVLLEGVCRDAFKFSLLEYLLINGEEIRSEDLKANVVYIISTKK